MADKSQIVYIKQAGYVHVAQFGLDVNLCSLVMEYNDDDESAKAVTVKPQMITCPSCLFIIRYVREIPARFLPKV